MPSPIGHALGGVLVALAMAPTSPVSRPSGSRYQLAGARTELMALCVIAACLPDIDFAWGRHNMETHSVGFALLLGLIALAWKRSPHVAIACALAAGSHVLFDWLGSDDFPPLGVMALWPWSSDFYFADAYVFATISRRYWLQGFVTHNVMSVAREVVILAPIVAGAHFLRRQQSR